MFKKKRCKLYECDIPKMCIVLGRAFKPYIQYHVKDMKGSLRYTLEIKNLFHKIVSTSQKVRPKRAEYCNYTLGK